MKSVADSTEGNSWSSQKKGCFASFSRLEVSLITISSILFALLSGICTFWLFYLDGYHIFEEGISSWKQRNPLFFSPSNKSIGYDPLAYNHNRLICTSRECANIAAFFATNLNEKVCDYFFLYFRHTIIDTQTLLHKQIKQILEAPIAKADKPWDKLAKDYYAKCLNEDALVLDGKTSIRTLLRKIGGWPVLEGNKWNEFEVGWEEYTAIVLNKTGVTAILFELTVSHDPNNSSKTVLEMDQPKFGIGSRWPYTGGINDSMVRNYTELMIQTAIRLGANETTVRAEMLEAVELEIKLVDYSSDETIRRDPDRSNNPYQLWQLKQHFPYIDFEAFVERVFDGIVNISQNDTIIIREMDYFKSIQHVLKSSSKRAIANYVGWRIVQGFSPFLPPRDREPFYEFKANQTGLFNVPVPERWEDCATLSIMLLDMPVGKLFVQNFFDEKFAMPKMTEMTTYLKKTFIAELEDLDWMDSATKERAIKKANAIQYKW
uniref:Peptidase M13 N-terminal domain-containing protein n=1 Tax=Panagrolaimus superbus TaxID=310955 RepID=A0A914YNY2_9BILA